MRSKNAQRRPGLIAFICSICISFLFIILLALPAFAAENAEISSEQELFSDLSINNPNIGYIYYLSQKGVISGFPDGSFKPEASLSRAQAAVILAKVMQLDSSRAGEKLFWDVDEKHWAAPYISACIKAGYIKSYPDGSFHPDEELSRAQGISLVLRLSKQDMSKAQLPPIEDVAPEHWAARHIATGLAAGMVSLDSSAEKFLPDTPFSRQEMCLALAKLLTQDPDH